MCAFALECLRHMLIGGLFARVIAITSILHPHNHHHTLFYSLQHKIRFASVGFSGGGAKKSGKFTLIMVMRRGVVLLLLWFCFSSIKHAPYSLNGTQTHISSPPLPMFHSRIFFLLLFSVLVATVNFYFKKSFDLRKYSSCLQRQCRLSLIVPQHSQLCISLIFCHVVSLFLEWCGVEQQKSKFF